MLIAVDNLFPRRNLKRDKIEVLSHFKLKTEIFSFALINDKFWF